MKLTHTQKEAKLREVAERLIQQALKWDEENKTPNLTQIEDEVLMLRQRFGQELAAVMVAGQESQQPVATPTCEKCKAQMR